MQDRFSPAVLEEKSGVWRVYQQRGETPTAFQQVLRLAMLPWPPPYCSVISEVFRVFQTLPQDFPRLT
jgi:hypothetical protein